MRIEVNEIKEWINSRVDAKFQRVTDVLVMEAFVRNVAGRVLKREMRDNYKKP